MSVIVPIGKKRREYLENVKRQSSKEGGKGIRNGLVNLPRKTSFVFNEEYALKKVVCRLFRDCPTLARQEDKEKFLVQLLQTMQEVDMEGFSCV